MNKTSLLELNIPPQNCMKTKELLEEVNKMKLMEDTMRKLAWEGFQKNIVMDGHTMIDKRTGEVLSPDVNSTYWKDKL